MPSTITGISFPARTCPTSNTASRTRNVQCRKTPIPANSAIFNDQRIAAPPQQQFYLHRGSPFRVHKRKQ